MGKDKHQNNLKSSFCIFNSLQEIESRTTHEDFGAGNNQDDEAVRTERYVGKLDLKQWSSDLERNKIMYSKSSEPIHPRNEDKERYITCIKNCFHMFLC